MSSIETRRRHPRYEVLAQVELARGGEINLFRLRNLSEGGAFVEADVRDYPAIVPGSRFELTISLAGTGAGAGSTPPPATVVTCMGRVVRRDEGAKDGLRPAGFGLVLEGVDGENLQALRSIIETAASAKR